MSSKITHEIVQRSAVLGGVIGCHRLSQMIAEASPTVRQQQATASVQPFFRRRRSPNLVRAASAMCSAPWYISKTWVHPGNSRDAAFQIHSAPSPKTVIVLRSAIPSRTAHSFQRGAKSSIVSIAANATRVVGAGRWRLSQFSGVDGSPRSRRAKMPIFMSRQPSVVLTLAASVWNSTSPGASANASATAGDSARKPAIRGDSAWQACRIRSSLTVQPQHSFSSRSVTAKEFWPPSRQISRVACRVRKPSKPRTRSAA